MRKHPLQPCISLLTGRIAVLKTAIAAALAALAIAAPQAGAMTVDTGLGGSVTLRILTPAPDPSFPAVQDEVFGPATIGDGVEFSAVELIDTFRGDNPVFDIDISAGRIDFTRVSGDLFSLGINSPVTATFSFDSPLSLSDVTLADYTGTPFSPDPTITVSGSDLSLIWLTGFGGTVRIDDDAFSVTFTDSGAPVAPIPLPAGAWLLLSGVGALGLLRRRRHGG